MVKIRPVERVVLRDAQSEWAGVPAPLLDAVQQRPVAVPWQWTPEMPAGTAMWDMPPVVKFYPDPAVENRRRARPKPGEPPREFWAAFRQDYRADGYVAFSDIVLAPEGLDALVYLAVHCGSLCGQGQYVWLHRNAKHSPWTVARVVDGWVS